MLISRTTHVKHNKIWKVMHAPWIMDKSVYVLRGSRWQRWVPRTRESFENKKAKWCPTETVNNVTCTVHETHRPRTPTWPTATKHKSLPFSSTTTSIQTYGSLPMICFRFSYISRPLGEIFHLVGNTNNDVTPIYKTLPPQKRCHQSGCSIFSELYTAPLY